jgi:glycosyltransferase involved in cell wall biosynthesis
LHKIRLAYLVTEPIIYQVPLLRRLASEPNLSIKVFFGRDDSSRQYDAGFGTPVRWDIPMLEGYDHETLPGIRRSGQVSFTCPFNYGLRSQLLKGHFDALWIHGYMRWNHWLAIASAKQLGLKVLIRDEATDISRERSPTRRFVRKQFFSWLARNVDAFLAIGTLNAAYYIRQGIDRARIFSVPYAVDNAFFQSEAKKCSATRDALRASLSISDRRPVILFVGKLMPRKRPNDLLRAYLALSPDGRIEPEAHLVFVGEGELKPALQRMAEATGWDSIKFVGFKNQSELPAFYNLCDVFVMPTVHEPWGLVVNEAMNAGRAIVVSSEVGCAPDLVRNGVNGITFRARDVDDLARALRTCLRDPERLTEMGTRSLQRINEWSFEEDILGIHSALRAT